MSKHLEAAQKAIDDAMDELNEEDILKNIVKEAIREEKGTFPHQDYRDWDTDITLKDVVDRPDSPVKEACISHLRTYPGDKRILLVAAKPVNEEEVAIRIKPSNNPSRFGCPVQQENPFADQTPRELAPDEVQEFKVSTQEAKSFFGTEPIKVAREVNRTVVRNIFCNGRLS